MKRGRWLSGPQLTLRMLNLATIGDYVPKREDPDKFKKQLRIAVTVGLKISKSAVQRNRLKRQLRETVRILLKEGALLSGYYLLLVAQNNLLGKTYPEISQETKLLLKRAGCLIG